MQPHLEAMAEHKNARRILLHLLAPDSPCWLPPALAALVHPPKRMAAVAAKTSEAAPGDVDEAAEALSEEVWQSSEAFLEQLLSLCET